MVACYLVSQAPTVIQFGRHSVTAFSPINYHIVKFFDPLYLNVGIRGRTLMVSEN